MKTTENLNDLITQSTVLEMGFTKSMIKKLLPAPIEKPNPHYSKGAPMKLWSKAVIVAIMETDDYKSELEKANKRKKSSAKAARAREVRLSEKMSGYANNIMIRVLSEDDLINSVLKDRETSIIGKLEDRVEYCYRNLGGKVDNDELEDAERELEELKTLGIKKPNDIATLNRWVVNYIRHHLIEYDYALYQLRGKTGKSEAYIVFKKAILEKIASTYPKYSDECMRQVEELNYDYY